MSSAVFLLGWLAGCGPAPETPATSAPAGAEAHLIVLRHGDLEVGVLPQVGGRVVLLRHRGGSNLLKSDPSGWQPEAWPELRADAPWRGFNGHIYWVAAQSEWWNRQDLLPQRAGQWWPPDPYLVFGDNEILEQSPVRVVLCGPPSPVSGLRLTKFVELRADNVVWLAAEAENIRDAPVSWGLWSNTRFHADTPFRVDLNGFGEEDIWYSHPHRFHGEVSADGRWFTFANEGAAEVAEPVANKAFMGVPTARAEIFFDDLILEKAMPFTEAARVHPEHASVEVFLQKHNNRADALLEIEFHGPYETLPPGGTIRLEETWTLRPRRD
ncbi:MAG: DUF4380 domain-containing protein [Opitutales bacterium]|nr:DUF4380 domain-containing protein [Opitutales bacterium]